MVSTSLSSISGKIGVDMSMLIHINLNRNARDILLNDDWSGFYTDMKVQLNTIRFWSSVDVVNVVICIFDGLRDERKLVNKARQALRSSNYEEVMIYQKYVHEKKEKFNNCNNSYGSTSLSAVQTTAPSSIATPNPL
eukprot:Awhi_evm2s4304